MSAKGNVRDDPMDVILRLKSKMELKPTIPLTAEIHAMFSAAGCDPHCHFCFEPLNVGTQFGFKRLKTGISGTACARCITEDRACPQAELEAVEKRRLEQVAIALRHEPSRPGFLLFD